MLYRRHPRSLVLVDTDYGSFFDDIDADNEDRIIGRSVVTDYSNTNSRLADPTTLSVYKYYEIDGRRTGLVGMCVSSSFVQGSREYRVVFESGMDTSLAEDEFKKAVRVCFFFFVFFRRGRGLHSAGPMICN